MAATKAANNGAHEEITRSSYDRYSMEMVQTSKFKHVPYEQIDYTIYKASTNTIAFTTTEERMPKWIEAFKRRYQDGLQDNPIVKTRWEEDDSKSDPKKCEKVVIHLTPPSETSVIQNYIIITAIITHGRIQIQGRGYKEWGNDEFPLLLDIVNSGLTENNLTNGLESFVKQITQDPKPTTGKENPTAEMKHEQNTSNCPTDETLMSSMRTSLASLEADFVVFKQNTQTSMNSLSTQLSDKNSEITVLNDEITSLKATNLQQQQCISDLTLKIAQSEEEHKKMQNKLKQLEKKNTSILQKIQTQNKESSETNEETNEQNQTTIAIPTKNNFETLQDNPDQPAVIEEIPEQVALPTTHEQQTNSSKDHQSSDTTNTKETIILCDSNGRHINPSLLCPGSTTSYLKCPTLSNAKKIIEQTTFTNPKTFLLHCGTNDLESNPLDESVIEQVKVITTIISKKHPESKIIISTLLPRKDYLDIRVKRINQSLEKSLTASPNISIVKHDNIQVENLYDKKHLNEIGVKRFALNLKRAYFGHSPPKAKNLRKTKSHDQQSGKPRWQFNTTPNIPFPMYHQHQNPTTNQHHPNTYTPHHYSPLNYNHIPTKQAPRNDAQQQTRIIPDEMVELIKLLHNRYVI